MKRKLNNMDALDLKYLFEDMEENNKYNEYLITHINNVKKGYEWFKEHLPHLLSEDNYIDEVAYYGELDDIIAQHDRSKYIKVPDADNYYELTCEYDAYADYFYGEQTPEVKECFDRAWLSHIHMNPHHWQHWMLQNDEDGLRLLDMPYVFIIEMCMDWWAFSWKENKLDEIFNWYEKNKKGILLSDKTRKTVEHILDELKKKLEEVDN